MEIVLTLNSFNESQMCL